MQTVNIGIIAHIDAGKTSLTERLLFDTCTIGSLGSVDAGTTQTDSDDIERRRGITVRTAVAPFMIGSTQVNLIDTPGHPEFIAEVERALRVLDGAILVVSAIEGVQAQTRVLMRSLRTMRLPTLIFVNKIDRNGARATELLPELNDKLFTTVIPMNTVQDPGTASARSQDHFDHQRVTEILADRDEMLIADVISGIVPQRADLLARTAEQTAAGLVCPVYFGSARTGAGIAELLAGIDRLLPRAKKGDAVKPQGTVFAIERGRGGEKIGYLRMFAGVVRRRDHLTWSRRDATGALVQRADHITAMQVVCPRPQEALTAGNIARIWGLPDLRVGDWIGDPLDDHNQQSFARPSVETLVHALDPQDAGRLHAALTTLADQDPLINAQVAPSGGTSVLLYGEIQKEIISEVLARDFGVRARFEPSQIVNLERPTGTGEAVEELGRNPFLATIGLRIEGAPVGTGIVFRRLTELGALPLSFDKAIVDTVYQVLQQGLYGWPVTDCRVTLIRSGFDNATSGGADFRLLTPLVLMRALAKAGTRVFEPCHLFDAEVPLDALTVVTNHLLGLEAVIHSTAAHAATWSINGEIPARHVPTATLDLPQLTYGEGSWWSRPHGDRQVRGEPPQRARTDGNPLKPVEYLRHLTLRNR